MKITTASGAVCIAVFTLSYYAFIRMESKRPCYRSRFTCKLCKQSLGYSAFRLHQDIPRLCCTSLTNSTQENASDSLNSIFEFDDLEDCGFPVHEPVNIALQDNNSTSSSSESRSSLSINDSGAEVSDETEECNSDSETEATQSPQTSDLTDFVVSFFVFFPLVISYTSI